jgi:hypothetical protein
MAPVKHAARLGGQNPSWFKHAATAAFDFPAARSAAIRARNRG